MLICELRSESSHGVSAGLMGYRPSRLQVWLQPSDADLVSVKQRSWLAGLLCFQRLARGYVRPAHQEVIVQRS